MFASMIKVFLSIYKYMQQKISRQLFQDCKCNGRIRVKDVQRAGNAQQTMKLVHFGTIFHILYIYCDRNRETIREKIIPMDPEHSTIKVFWFGLMLYVPVNSYDHVGTVNSPNHILGKLDFLSS